MYGTPSNETSSDKPRPRITPLNKPFWDNAKRNIYSIQVCQSCRDAHVPESPVCPNCLSEDQAWEPASGKGTLESWTDFHRAYWDGFSNDLPYRTCLVRLDEGPLVISNLTNDRGDLKIGQRVSVVFERVTDEFTLPKFRIDAE